jgi:hypothetical protein
LRSRISVLVLVLYGLTLPARADAHTALPVFSCPSTYSYRSPTPEERARARERREEKARIRREKRERMERFLSSEEMLHPERFRSMRRRRNWGWALLVGGYALGQGVTSVDDEDVSDGVVIVGGAGAITAMITGGVYLLQYRSYVRRGYRDAEVYVSPGGAGLVLKF